MVNRSTDLKKIFWTNGAALGWVAVIFQFYLIIANRTASLAETITRFFGYFTILTNILVALCFTFLLLWPASKLGSFFARPAVQTAIAVYITVVGIIYNVILRFQWNPRGLQYIVDELLHTLIPALFIVYWFLFVRKETLKWKYIPAWLIYPAVYCLYSLIRGELFGFYPYPFVDVNILGYNRVLFNAAGMVIVFLVVSATLVGVSKLGKNSGTHVKM